MKIRRLTEIDAEALWKLRLAALEGDPQAFAETAEHHRNTPASVHAERLRSTDNPVFGAFDGPLLAGMAGLYREAPGTGRIWGMFVLPSHRSQGAGRALLEAVLEYALAAGDLRSVRLEVAGTQAAARSLYLSCGFRPEGTGPHGAEEMLLPLDRGGSGQDAISPTREPVV